MLDPELRNRLEQIQIQIAGMRRGGRCGAGASLTAEATWSRTKTSSRHVSMSFR